MIIKTKSVSKSKRIGDEVIPMSKVVLNQNLDDRVDTTIDELNRVLGGNKVRGLVSGEVVLLGGEPGVGKSTLLTQVVIGMLSKVVQSKPEDRTILYVAGEESPQQILIRVQRLVSSLPRTVDGEKEQNNVVSTLSTLESIADRLIFVNSTIVESVVESIRSRLPSLVIVDSVQSLTSPALTGGAGSIGQVKEATTQLVTIAKDLNIPLILVGHVTKEGRLAGPMLLEHMVDAVLELTGDRSTELRLLRAVKNRFGATDEVGVFRMTESGFQTIGNPSQFFLETRDSSQAGSAISCVMEGTRPLLVEVQALTVRSSLPQPRRVGRGLPSTRLNILTAVLEKHCGLPLSNYDVFVSVAGGYETKEAALDLAICAALASSVVNKPVPEDAVFTGEVGLLGEIRRTPMIEKRSKEAVRLGIKNIYSREQSTTLKNLLQKLKITK